MARASRFDPRRKVLEKYARLKQGEDVYPTKKDKRGQFRKALGMGLAKLFPKAKGKSYREIEKSKMTPEEKFRLILEASRKR